MKTQDHLTIGKHVTVGGSMVHILICDDDIAFAQAMVKESWLCQSIHPNP